MKLVIADSYTFVDNVNMFLKEKCNVLILCWCPLQSIGIYDVSLSVLSRNSKLKTTSCTDTMDESSELRRPTQFKIVSET